MYIQNKNIYNFTYYALSSAQKCCLYIMLNIMPISTAIMPQFIYNYYFND